MEVKIFREHGADLLLTGEDVSVDVRNPAAFIINHNTFGTGMPRRTSTIIPWCRIIKVEILDI